MSMMINTTGRTAAAPFFFLEKCMVSHIPHAGIEISLISYKYRCALQNTSIKRHQLSLKR